MGTRSLAVLILVPLLLLGSLPAVVAAHPLPHPEPRVVNLRPAPGALVPAGSVNIAALVTGPAAVDDHRVSLDGQPLSARSSGGDHTTVTATAQVQPGWHTVEIFASSAGEQTRREWRFHAARQDVVRLAGETRLTTAITISRDRHPQAGSASSALLANSRDFASALPGAPLAHARGGPLLLTSGEELESQVGSELERALAEDAVVYLLGDTGLISERVASDLRDRGLRSQRIGGNDAYETAAAIARRMPAANTLIVASGETFPDALSVSSPAADRGLPIVLTRADSLPSATRTFIRDGEWSTVIVAGGPDAISEGVAEQIRTESRTADVARVAGPTRYETAAAVARTFFADPDTVGLVSGLNFPDALAGGPHAAAHQAPLLLSTETGLPAPSVRQIEAHAPGEVFVYGGEAAVPATAVDDATRATANANAPQVVEFAPPPGDQVQTLDEIVVTFDRGLDIAASSVYVTIGGHEVVGTTNPGDFADTIVFVAEQLPEGLQPGTRYPLEITIAATDGRTWRFVEQELTYAKPLRTLSRGDSGPQVQELQQRLLAANYWLAAVDGEFENTTHQAVLALQKVHGLRRDGVYGPQTRAVLESDPARPQPRSKSGLVVEVDKQHQVVLIVSDGNVAHIFNSSTGTGEPYEYGGKTYIADTPSGEFQIFRQIDGWRESHLGRLYRPKYFNGGIALHGSTSVPAYPASHGCVRVSIPAMDFLWPRLPIGVEVLVY